MSSLDAFKQIVDFVAVAGNAFVSASQAQNVVGKVSSFLPILEDLSILVTFNYAKLEEDLKSLSEEDLTALGTYIDSKFPASVSPDLKAKVEAVVTIAIDLAQVIDRAIGLWRKPQGA